MRVRRYTWAEFDAWLVVTARAERLQRCAATLDAFHATRGEIAAFEKHLEKLGDGE